MPNLIIAFPKKEDCIRLRSLMMRGGWQISCLCTSGVAVLQAADHMTEGIVICGHAFHDMSFRRLREDLDPAFAMILLASGRGAAGPLPDGIDYLQMPVRGQDLLQKTEEVSDRMNALAAQRGRRRRSTAMDRQISMAKQLLMELNGMTEEQAHRYIQKTSMDTGTNMAQTAQMLLDLMERRKGNIL